MNNDSNKQKKYTIGVSIASALSFILFAYSLATPSAQPQSKTFSIEAKNNPEIEAELEEFEPTAHPIETPSPKPIQTPTPTPTASPTLLPTATPTLQPTETPVLLTEAPALPTEVSQTQTAEESSLQSTETPVLPPVVAPETQSVVTSSNQGAESALGENNFSNDDNTTSQNTGSVMVWIDDTAKRYHKKNGCGMDNAYQVTLEEAIQRGKTPCGRCYK